MEQRLIRDGAGHKPQVVELRRRSEVGIDE